MRNSIWIALLVVSGCAASSVPPTVQVGPTDTVVELGLAESCEAVEYVGWMAVEGAFLEDGDTLLARVRHCPEASLEACGAMAPEDIYPGWFNVTLGARGAETCSAPVERVLRVDLSSSRVTRNPGLDRVDQRAIRPSAGGAGPQVVPVWIMGD